MIMVLSVVTMLVYKLLETPVPGNNKTTCTIKYDAEITSCIVSHSIVCLHHVSNSTCTHVFGGFTPAFSVILG